MTINPADKNMGDMALRILFSGDIPKRDRIDYYLDENIMSIELVDMLRQNNIVVVTVEEREHSTEASDLIVLADARTLGCVFVTRDRGIQLLHERILNLPGTSHAGILLFAERLTVQSVAQVLMRFAEKSVDYPGIISSNTLFEFS